MDPPPSTLDAFSVELMQPLQKLWEKVMHKDKHTDSYITAARLDGGRLFFLVYLGTGAAVSDMRIR